MMKSLILKTLTLGLCVMLSGCAFWQDAPVEPTTPAPKVAVVDAAPRALTQNLALYQQLFVQTNYDDAQTQSSSFEAYLLADARRIKLNLVMTQMPVWEIIYDGQTIYEQRHHEVPAELNARYLLSDIALAYWPEQYLARQLTPMTIKTEDNQRLIYDEDGVLLTEIIYSDGATPEKPQGTITLTNRPLRYRLTINSQWVR